MNAKDIVQKRLKMHEFTRFLAFGSSNTQRFIPGMHWFDCLDLAATNTFGPYHAAINRGIGGETAADLLGRFERDCVLFQPHIVIVTVGGNDSNPERKTGRDAFHTNLTRVVQRIRDVGAEPVLQTYYAADITAMDAAYARTFTEFMGIIRTVAGENDIMLIDHNSRWERLRTERYDVYKRIMMDALHVNETGNLLLGADIVRAFNMHLPEHPYFREARALQAVLDMLGNAA